MTTVSRPCEDSRLSLVNHSTWGGTRPWRHDCLDRSGSCPRTTTLQEERRALLGEPPTFSIFFCSRRISSRAFDSHRKRQISPFQSVANFVCRHPPFVKSHGAYRESHARTDSSLDQTNHKLVRKKIYVSQLLSTIQAQTRLPCRASPLWCNFSNRKHGAPWYCRILGYEILSVGRGAEKKLDLEYF